MQAYLRHGRSVPATARVCFVHHNTVRYRLGVARDLLRGRTASAGPCCPDDGHPGAIWSESAERGSGRTYPGPGRPGPWWRGPAGARHTSARHPEGST
ncbi:helix-turn-helix domain-containing protein [Arsenicicoccus bolidensis]|uniref:helix-turn-helix domain-containing protein n=1 Tax=Arsenicicoccus bolidensis TaxID=229480 RepID=UPI0035561FB2